MEIKKVSLAFLGLGQELRYRVYRHIVNSGADGVRPNEIKEAIKIPQATLSFHLKQLLISELVRVERRGTSLIYTCNRELLKIIQQEINSMISQTDLDKNAVLSKPRIKIKTQEME
jgi:DNA-binding transcriptional ArsR family regulator